MISNAGGMDPRWVRGGTELIYFSGDDTLSAATVGADESGFRATTKTEPLFRAARTTNRTNYGVTSDGQRFLINTVGKAAEGATISVVLNWPQTLKP